MELIERRIIVSTRNQPWELHFLGDMHVGSLAFDKEAFEKRVAHIEAQPNAYWIGMGDYIDAIGYRDKRFDPRDIAPDMKVKDLDDLYMWQARAAIKLLEPIRGKCLGMLTGNHEEAVRLYSHLDPVRSLAEHFGVPDLRYAATVRVLVHDAAWVERNQPVRKHAMARYSVLVYCHHGFGGGRKAGSKVNKAAYDLGEMAPSNADITAMGHVHEDVAGKKAWLEVSRNGEMCIIPRQRVWVLTGSFRKNWHRGITTYSEKAGFPMVNIGSPYVVIKEDRVRCLSARGQYVQRDIPTFQVIGS